MAETGKFAGVWTYRAFLNDPDVETPFNDLRFATARLDLADAGDGRLTGTLAGEGWGTWIAWSLKLIGAVDGRSFRLRGENVIEGETWIYDYQGAAVHRWRHGIDARDVLAGSVIRTQARARRQSKAGVHATFVAVRR